MSFKIGDLGGVWGQFSAPSRHLHQIEAEVKTQIPGIKLVYDKVVYLRLDDGATFVWPDAVSWLVDYKEDDRGNIMDGWLVVLTEHYGMHCHCFNDIDWYEVFDRVATTQIAPWQKKG